MAAELTRYLTERDRFGGKSPLEAIVATELQALTKVIAQQVIAEHADLNAHIGRMVRDVVAAAMRENTALQEYVVRAVAEALAVRARDIRVQEAQDDG